ncbi:Aste57867_5324 [Aphanomyces stellatus]|uniref:Aste57867_5324 protein n=1 Tax=Aphanomyces stellatus TaxID=120398 RepID=A0A485KEE2_9STRA|nr:hypothetical protein As57867_005311 [Aphanomyces stellatus]VFT82389.1 Aste57867_5324 [Aphanomyces stellatus]
MLVIWFAGLRGAISFALVKTWSHVDSAGVSHRSLIVSTTLIIVVFTTLVIGGLTGPLLEYIKKKSPETIEAPDSPKHLQEPRLSFVHSLAHGDLVNPEVRRRTPRPEHNETVVVQEGAGVAALPQDPQLAMSRKFEKTWKNVDENYLKRWFGGRKKDPVDHDGAADETEEDEMLEMSDHNSPIHSPVQSSPKASAYMPASPSQNKW